MTAATIERAAGHGLGQLGGAVVALDDAQYAAAEAGAARRAEYAAAHGCADRAGAAADIDSRRRRDLIGAVGEMAFACWAGCRWDPTVGKLGLVDFAGWLEIRTRWQAPGKPPPCLIFRAPDVKHRGIAFVHCIAAADLRSVHIAGWIAAEDGQREEYWRQDMGALRPGWVVPNAALLPLDILPRKGKP